MALQQRNDEMMDLLRSEYQGRYEPNFAWKSACSAFLALPGLHGFWPMSSLGSAGAAVDISGQGRELSYNGNPTYNYDGLMAYIDLDGTGDYLDINDSVALSITGTETYIDSAVRGLTFGCWTQTSVATTEQSIFGKWNSVGDNRSYNLKTSAADRFQLQITNLGTLADIDAVNDSVDYDTGEWYFIVGRFDPSTAIYIDVNGRNTSNVAGIPASIFDSTADLVVGARNNGSADLYTGYVSCAFLCASFLSDAIVGALFEQTRAAFGV